MAVKKFRKANSANDGAEWWIADTVADLPIDHNPAIKIGDLAIIKPETSLPGDKYDTYMFQYVSGTSGPKHWVLYIDNDTPAAGEVNTASNVGIGEGLSFKAKVGTDLQFRTLKAGANTTIVTSGNEITISAAGPDGGEVNTASNVGTGEGIFKTKVGADLQFKTLKAGTNVTITQTGADELTITSIDTGEANTASTVGNGEGIIITSKQGTVLPFKSIKAGNNITIDNNADDVTINANVGDVVHPVRIETVCGKIYCITTYMGVDYAVEMTELTYPTPVECVMGYQTTLNNQSAVISAANLLASIPAGTNTYSLSKDGITYGPASTNPASATLNYTCADPIGVQTPVYLKVVGECGENICTPMVTINVTNPSPICLNGLSTEIQPGGLSPVWLANDFLQSVTDAGNNGAITLSVSKDGGITYTPSVQFDCNDAAAGFVEVYVKATNACGGSDYCVTVMLVQDNFFNCEL